MVRLGQMHHLKNIQLDLGLILLVATIFVGLKQLMLSLNLMLDIKFVLWILNYSSYCLMDNVVAGLSDIIIFFSIQVEMILQALEYETGEAFFYL